MAAYINARPAGEEDFNSDDDGFNFDNAYSSSTPFDDTPFRDLSEAKFAVGSPPRQSEQTTSPSEQKQSRLPRRDKQGSLLVADDLRTVILKGKLDPLKKVFQEGVPVDFRLRDGWTCLMYAASAGHVDIVEFLLQNKADPNFSSDLFTPLMAACSSTAPEEQILQCVKQLIENGARVNSHDRHFITALMFASKSGLLSVANHLIQCKCDLNKQDNRGWTAIYYAAAGGFTAIVKLLLDNKARTKVRCSEGTLSDIAYNNGHEKLTQLIEEHENPEMYKMKNDCEEKDGLSEKNASKSRENYQRYGDLELFLFGLNLGHLIPVFQQHQLDFTNVLQMTEQDLEKIGISELGVRKKMLKSIHEVHKKKWEPGSIRTPNSKVLSCKESIDIIENISKHVCYISSTISYIKRNLIDHSALTSQKVDNTLVEKLSRETTESLVNVKSLHTELKQLRKHVSEATSKMDMVPADLVEEPESQRSLLMRRIVPSMLTLTVTVATMWIKPSHMSTAFITATIVGLKPPPLISVGVATWFFYWTTQTVPFSIEWLTSRFS